MFPRNLKEQLELMHEKKYNSHETAKGGWKHSTFRLLEVTEFPICNNADTDWYVRMPTNANPTEREVEMLL